ncbi:MAG: AAA family ATPase [Euryarchaeota archaeon]|nr:AAA family ATPase [Euryarchaeota archaeon]
MIKEVILENFMSYEYARVPLRGGVNIICGPNGSGKSSIILALAVALGQTYTERSRRLSDLIRRGKDFARVTVVLDNRPKTGNGGARPIGLRGDDVRLSRYMKRSGEYWHEVDFKAATRGEVERLLADIGLDPDNMLLVMHQNMIETFGLVSPAEKLRMVEEAAGLADYRARVLEAQGTLRSMAQEAGSVDAMLRRAEETLQYWEREHGKWLRKQELQRQQEALRLEEAWAAALRAERQVETLTLKIEEKTRAAGEARREAEGALGRAGEARGELETRLMDLESRLLQRREMDRAAESRRGVLEAAEGMAEARARGAVEGFRADLLERERRQLERDRVAALKERDDLRGAAEAQGARVETQRKPSEVGDERRLVEAHLQALEGVTEEVEGIYDSYRRMADELREKARVADENRQRALAEVDERKGRWRQMVSDLLQRVGGDYRRLLGVVGATGDLRLVEAEDLEKAGLELLVGFRGSEPQVLDAYTQSGGERTTSVMAFLLSLQRYVHSPVRAIDEFDVHMDPINRETVMRQILGAVGDSQYLYVTPGTVVVDDKSHVIVVQNTGGRSQVKVAI